VTVASEKTKAWKRANSDWAREYEKLRKRRIHADPERRDKENETQRRYRESLTASQKEKYRKSMLARHRSRMLSDPDYKQRHRAQQKRATARRRGAVGVGEPIRRDLLYKRDRGICHICLRPAGAEWVMDHVIPIAAGGRHMWHNVAVAHRECNQRKGARQIHLF